MCIYTYLKGDSRFQPRARCSSSAWSPNRARLIQLFDLHVNQRYLHEHHQRHLHWSNRKEHGAAVQSLELLEKVTNTCVDVIPQHWAPPEAKLPMMTRATFLKLGVLKCFRVSRRSSFTWDSALSSGLVLSPCNMKSFGSLMQSCWQYHPSTTKATEAEPGFAHSIAILNLNHHHLPVGSTNNHDTYAWAWTYA